MNKKQAQELTNEVLLVEALVKIKALETLLIEKKVFSKEEFDTISSDIMAKISKVVLQKANVPGDLDVLIKNLSGNKLDN